MGGRYDQNTVQKIITEKIIERRKNLIKKTLLSYFETSTALKCTKYFKSLEKATCKPQKLVLYIEK